MPLQMMLAVAEGPLAGPVRRKLMRKNGFPQVCEVEACLGGGAQGRSSSHGCVG